MALAAALGTSAIYLLQPAIADVASTLDSDVGAVGMALACGPIGYMCGLALLVPLVDRFPPSTVLALQFAVLAVSLVATAATQSVWLLGATMVATGAYARIVLALPGIASWRTARRPVVLRLLRGPIESAHAR